MSVKSLKKMMLGIFMLATLPVFGQGTFDALKGSVATTPPDFTKNVAVGFNIGVTNGIGVDVAYRFAKHWAGKIALNYADYAKNGYQYSYQSTTNGTTSNNIVAIDGSVKMSSLSVNFEYSPGEKGRFKLVGGLAFLPNNTVTIGGEILSVIKFNDVTLNSDDIGSGNIQVGFSQKVSPYIGMGFGRTFPRKRLNVSVDLGTQYKGDYTVKINMKPGLLLKQNEDNAVILARNFNEKWYGHFFPVVNLRLAYRIF